MRSNFVLKPYQEGDAPKSRKEIDFETASRLFLKHHGLVKGVAMRFAPSKDIVDDIVHQVYIEFVEKSEKWDLESDVSALLAVITKNFARRMWREYADSFSESRQRILDYLRHHSESRQDSYGYDDELRALENCVQSLPPKAKQLVYDYYFAKIPMKDIAVSMQKKAETLRRALCRYRKKLLQCIVMTLKKKRDI